jgi:predicted HicB family RNase H-like nuclease
MVRSGDNEAWVQLATRIPKDLHRQLKLHCVHTESSLMGFVVGALREKLARESGRKRGRSAS